MVKKIIFFVSLTFKVSFCRSPGPPTDNSVCNDLKPSKSSPHRLQVGNGTYSLSVDAYRSSFSPYFMYTSGQNYSITLRSEFGVPLKGFLVQAWDQSNNRIGAMKITDPVNQRLLDCSAVNPRISPTATIAHAQPNKGQSIQFMWTAPSTSAGLVDFRFTIVKNFFEYFGPLSAASADGSIAEDILVKVPSNMSYGVVKALFAQNSQQSVVIPTRKPEAYAITASIPDVCEPSVCDLFVGIDINKGSNSYLDIYMDGNAHGWVAVGFSDTPDMFDSDVLVCLYNHSYNVVEGLDTFNAPLSRKNSIDSVQNIIFFKGEYKDGRIKCILARSIAGSDVPSEDRDLNESYYMLYARGNTVNDRHLDPHYPGPSNRYVTNSKINPTKKITSMLVKEKESEALSVTPTATTMDITTSQPFISEAKEDQEIVKTTTDGVISNYASIIPVCLITSKFMH